MRLRLLPPPPPAVIYARAAALELLAVVYGRIGFARRERLGGEIAREVERIADERAESRRSA